jgi:2,3-bisphosphoglycerate-independent phosphoglycerate mutase
MALFGYDPISNHIGRGVAEAAGVGLQVGTEDVAARGNFCTVDRTGRITDRRAGRIASEVALPLVERLGTLNVPGAEIEIRHVREYRFVLVMHGTGLHADITDTDPQQTGVPPRPVVARSEIASNTADLFNQWIHAAGRTLVDQMDANMVTLRGFASDPQLSSFKEMYALDAASITVYPMYRGVSLLAGMQTITFAGESPGDQFAAVRAEIDNHNFFLIHIKATDSCGEEGDFKGKVAVIEAVDSALPALLHSEPDVIVVTGDHSTPARMRSHSWHPVPLLLWAPETARQDRASEFGETACTTGGLGSFPATDVVPLMLAHGRRLSKFGS